MSDIRALQRAHLLRGFQDTDFLAIRDPILATSLAKGYRRLYGDPQAPSEWARLDPYYPRFPALERTDYHDDTFIHFPWGAAMHYRCIPEDPAVGHPTALTGRLVGFASDPALGDVYRILTSDTQQVIACTEARPCVHSDGADFQ